MISALCTSVLQALELLELQWQQRFRELNNEWSIWVQKEEEELTEKHNVTIMCYM